MGLGQGNSRDSDKKLSLRSCLQFLHDLIADAHQSVDDAGFTGGVTSITDDLQPRTQPDSVQGGGVVERTDHVVATMYDMSGDRRQSSGACQQRPLLQKRCEVW